MTRLLITLALLEALAVALAYVLDWLQGPVTDVACQCEAWDDAMRGWFCG